MTLTIFAMVLISATLHPLREFYMKGNPTPEGLVFSVMAVFGLLSGVQVAVTGADPWAATEVWGYLAVSSGGIIVYYFALVGTMRHGDLSIYYPITRSSPLFVVLYGLLVQGQSYPLTMLAGIACVLVGAFMLQYEPGTRFFAQPRTLALATLVMVMHGVITIADAGAMQHVEPIQFLFLQYLFLVPVIGVLFVVTRPDGRGAVQHLLAGWVKMPGRFAVACLTAYVSYYLILTAFQWGANVAAVASVRQVSIPVSVLLGGLFLKETRMTGRLAWSVLLALGVVLIILTR